MEAELVEQAFGDFLPMVRAAYLSSGMVDQAGLLL